MSIVSEFVAKVQAVYNTGIAREHAYRPALHDLLKSLGDNLIPVNDAARTDVGAPDFILLRGDIAIGHLEAKDINLDIRVLNDINKRQQDRYRAGLSNLIYTNCLDWDFYRAGNRVAFVSIADFLMGIQPRPDKYAQLENLLHDFILQRPQTITSPRELAERMAGKAALIKDVLFKAVTLDKERQTALAGQFIAFKEHLIHDISEEDFADVYAETIAYGMFAARLHDNTPDTFSRAEALELLPQSNPFLRSLFGYVAGHELDQRIRWIIDDLADVFQATDMHAIMEGFGKLTGRDDPFLHFYETFLAAYNPKKRKARGVWYTPEPVVNFIVRAVDEVLKTEFGLADGLADTSKVTIDWDTGQTQNNKPITLKKDVHRVQILDPATGTGTFLAEVIKQIAPKVKGVAEGMWSSYIENDLIPRLHGFELLMASYAMCHMKLDMVLTEMGYKPSGAPPRLSVYLTNSLEEGLPANQTLPFAQWLSNEVKAANSIKRDMPIMCVIGNPPYAGESANKGEWIMRLMEAYKKEPGGKERLRERNPKWINDDYVKFIRLAEHLINKNGEGVLSFITNHGYLDNPTFRGMRWQLLTSFDTIYVLDLHGNAKKKEVAPGGSADKNVFDIQQGVAILIGVKRAEAAKNKPLATVFHGEIWGDRNGKYETLWGAGLQDALWQKLEHHAPQYPFVRRDYGVEAAYCAGFSVADLMPINSVGIVTARDALTIDMDKAALWQRLQDFVALEPETARRKYDLGGDARDWQVAWAQRDARDHLEPQRLVPIAYRPFDTRWTFYTGNSRGFMCYPRNEVMRELAFNKNSAFCISKQSKDGIGALLVNSIAGHKAFGAYDINSIFPLYQFDRLDQSRRVNFDPKIYAEICEKAGLGRVEGDEIKVFDYIYGVLHCPAYRETYAQFLKSGFPRIPFPASPAMFQDIAAKGEELRRLHLMEPAAIGETPFPFKGEGTGLVEKVETRDGKIWINAAQYFDNPPKVAWEFYIGGYQPAQKWLKDRKGLQLSFEDVKHYQRILKILAETDRIMKTITMNLNS